MSGRDGHSWNRSRLLTAFAAFLVSLIGACGLGPWCASSSGSAGSAAGGGSATEGSAAGGSQGHPTPTPPSFLVVVGGAIGGAGGPGFPGLPICDPRYSNAPKVPEMMVLPERRFPADASPSPTSSSQPSATPTPKPAAIPSGVECWLELAARVCADAACHARIQGADCVFTRTKNGRTDVVGRKQTDDHGYVEFSTVTLGSYDIHCTYHGQTV
jgi:hypothetical protein